MATNLTELMALEAKKAIEKITRKRKLKYQINFALKVTWLAMQAASKKWTMPLHHWNVALNRFMIEYHGRLPRGY